MLKLTSNPSQYVSKMVAAALLSASVVLSGCATGDLATSLAPTTTATALQISGTAYGGSSPISGALVSLYATGTSGYGAGAPSPLIATTYTDQTTGAFTFPTSFVPADCSATQGPWVYVTVAGGDPTGASGNANGTAAAPSSASNHAILLAAVLGNCSGLGSSTKVKINEATTVAAAYALNNFSTVTGSAGTLASLNIGAPTTNAQGLSDAVATAQLLVSPTTGNVNVGTATMLLPNTTVASLANIMSVCVNSAEYTSVGCSQVLPLAKTPGSSTQPNNVFQALQNIARYPGNNVSALLNAAPSQGPFQPTLAVSATTSSTAPNDLSLGIAYANSTLATATAGPVALAIDNTDNVWVLGANNGTSNYIGELLSPSAGATYSSPLASSVASTQNVRWGAFDVYNNLWLSDGAALQVYNGGTTTPTAQSFSTLTTGGTSTLDPNNYVVALDGAGNVFTATYGAAGNCIPANAATASANVCDAIELAQTGGTGLGGTAPTSYSPVDQFNSAYVSTPSVRGIFADANQSLGTYRGNAWFTNFGVTSATKGGTTTAGNAIEVLTPATKASANTGTVGNVNTITVGPSGAGLWGIALDNSSSAYIVASTIPSLYYVPATTANSATISTPVTANIYTTIPTSSSAPSSSTVSTVAGGLGTPANAAVDGAGNVFVSNTALGSVVEYSPGLAGYVSPYFGYAPSVAVAAQTATVTKYKVASGVVTFTANNTLTPGTVVTITSTVTALNGLQFTVLSSGLSGLAFTAFTALPTTSSTTVTGTTAAAPASSQTLLNCTSSACLFTGQTVYAGPAIAVDRSGSVWTLSTTGTLLQMIGTAAPTNPVLAAGSYGVTP